MSRPLVLAEPVDAVVSVATLHWLPDHESVFRGLVGVLRPGGVLRAEWGGAGNVANVDAVLGELGLPRLSEIAHYATVEQTTQRLRAAGFVDVRVRAVPGVAPLGSGAQRQALLRAVVLDRVPPEEHDRVVAEVASRLGREGVRYVRLQVAADAPGPERDSAGTARGRQT